MKFEYSEQKLTEQELADFEKEFKIKLPPSYKKVMLEYNGGSPEKEYFEGNSVFFESIKYGNYPLENCIAIVKDVLPKDFFPFANYGSGLLCILLKGEKQGEVYYFDESGEIELVADSFDEFMERLTDDPDE